ncbi:SRPBCC domain-containing protein [Pantoea sp. AS142]|uniref:SRPBCC domain-containing protein n=1 Tax=Pantoea sp. AS142 TaxID=3081292 RepID=UPI00301925CB
MIILKHAIKISAPRSTVYIALTDPEAMRRWHIGTIEGTLLPGQVLTLTSASGKRFGWRTEKLEADSFIVQTGVEGMGTSVGKTLTFNLSDLDEGRTLVELADGEWSERDPHLPFCNTHWGRALHNLKTYLEKS